MNWSGMGRIEADEKYFETRGIIHSVRKKIINTGFYLLSLPFQVLLEIVGGERCFIEKAFKFLSGNQARLDQFLAFVSEAGVEPEGEPPGPSGGDESTGLAGSVAPAFCGCGKCREMNLPAERKCCGQRECLSNHPEFLQHCLDREALRIAIDDHADVYAGRKSYNNNNFRFQAYRRFTLWHHGKLGRGNRVPAYSCIVWAVRDKYPSESGIYKGFIETLRSGQDFSAS